MAKIKLQGVRLSFPSLFRKAVFQGEETKYEATLLLDKEKHAASIAEINEAIKKGIADNFKGAKIPADKICFKDGDSIDYDGYAGCMSIKAANNRRPIVIDRDKRRTIIDGELIAYHAINRGTHDRLPTSDGSHRPRHRYSLA